VPQFCRHNRFVHRCPICSRESSETTAPIHTPARRRADKPAGVPARRSAAARRGASGVRVRRVAVGPEDGYASGLLPGLRSSQDALRLADELAFAAGRLEVLEDDPPGLYGEAASAADPEEGLWLAFAIAYLGPLEGPDPWAGVRSAVGPWAEGAELAEPQPPTGPRGAHDPARGRATLAAYGAWAARAGSQAAALAGEAAWAPGRRFARAYERLALPGLTRDARFEFLVTAGRLGLADLRADALHLGGADDVTTGAKRVFGIADTHLLERRVRELAEATRMPLDALDLALFNWQQGQRVHGGVDDAALDSEARAQARAALGLPLDV
jgi:Alpha-glutamyl/putrescinyl thymine pyrophosphorylase clade 3